MSSEPPAKKSRKRSRQSDAEEPSVTQAAGPGVRVEQPNYARGSVWFDDGNIVFVAEGTAFRVYRGILSRNSDVFHDMFTVPQPPDEDKWEGCDVVHFTDSAADWGSILSILFDSSQTTHGMWGRKSVPSFTTVVAMLQLGRKYSIDALAEGAIDRLQVYFPTKLIQFVNDWTDCNLNDFDEPCDFPQHTIAVINLARQLDLPRLLPSAFYLAAQLSEEILVLGYKDDGGRQWRLSREDLYKCLVGRSSLHERDIHYLTARPCTDCLRRDECTKQLDSCKDTGVNNFTAPLASFTGRLKLCEKCSSHFGAKQLAQRKEAWNNLANFFLLEGLEWPVPDPTAGAGDDKDEGNEGN